jgi:hypothetical protein
MPDSIAVLGDSMSVATGTQGIPASEQPQNSWSTGTNSSVNSLYQRILALNPSISGNNRNMAANGEDMNDAPTQANNTPSDTELVTIQLGGNNLCKSSVGAMTTVAQYRSSLVQTLDIIQNRMPNALIQIQSVPDIYNLWFLRGAPNPPNDQPSSRAGTARTFWGLGLIPCESLVANATSMDQADIDRRNAVRQRNIEYNAVLAEECEKRLRCRFDRYATFNFSSNRATPPFGDYLPRAQWQFVDDDNSTIDHYHPGLSGQRKMAEAAWASGYDFTDSTMPVGSYEMNPAPLSSGVSYLPTTVDVTWTDAAGIKGVQHRIHQNGVAGPWQTDLGTTTGPVDQYQAYSYVTEQEFSVDVSTVGTTYIESRAMDSNGNMSASKIVKVEYDPDALPTPEINSSPPGITASGSASFSFSGAIAGTTYECSLDGSPFAACTSPVSYDSLADGDHEFRVRVKSAATSGPISSFVWHIDSSAPPAPSISSGPPSRTRLTVATFTFSGTEAELECSLDGSAFASCTSPRQVFVPADGLHRFEVRQKTITGTPGTSAVYIWTVDNTAPAAPVISSAPNSPTNQTSASVSFSGEPGGTFRCVLDNAQISTCTSPWTRSNLSEGTHTLAISQRDQVDNQGPAAFVTWTIDLTAPPAPTVNTGPSGLTASRDVSITFSGESGGTYQCSLDGAPFFFCSSPRNLVGLEDGDHDLRIRQIDSAGNAGPISSRSWSVDATPPDMPQITDGPAPFTNLRSSSFGFTGEPGSTFECSLDEAPFSTCDTGHVVEELPDGSHQLKVRQRDAAGNRGSSATREWTVDTIPPAAPTIGPQTLELSINPNRQLGFTGEPGGFFECRMNEGAWGVCPQPWSATFPGPGNHSFDVRQTDDAGNTGPTARGTVLVWAGPPSTPVVTSAPRGTVRSTSAEVRFTVGPIGAPVCSLNGGSWKPCDGVWTAQDLDQGPQSLVINQRNEVPGPTVTVEWTVDTLAPRLSGPVRAKPQGKRRNSKPVNWILASTYERGRGQPATLEFSTAKRKPAASAAPVKARTRKWQAKLAIRSKPKPTWVRVFDGAGNGSGWFAVK